MSHPILAADEVPGETSPLIGDAYPAALADAATAVAPRWRASATGVSMEESVEER
ncbi:hypothetical protein ACFY6U_34385 [Streptomyces sp. NPDC013157]|uniref:hypothetical protein n=1 Tax=Streptomyces sp. NPDC013157 TaxID=3364861 RepID=UPI003697D3E7